MLRARLRERRVLRRDVRAAELLDQAGVPVRLARQRVDGDLEPAQPRDERGEEADRARAEDARAARLPDQDPALDLEGVVDALLGHGRRLEQHADLDEVGREREDEAVILDVVLGQVPVQEVDPALEVHVVGGEVLQPDLPVDRRAGPAHGRDHVRPGADRRRHVRPDLDDLAEALVAGDEEVVPGRRGAVLGRVDLLVGSVDADAKHLHLHAAAVRNVLDARLRDLAEVHRVGLPWMNGDGFHVAIEPRRAGSLQPGTASGYAGGAGAGAEIFASRCSIEDLQAGPRLWSPAPGPVKPAAVACSRDGL